MEIFISTSRRTPKAVEDYLKERLSPESRCRVLIITNEYNPSGAVESILGLSDIVLVSEEIAGDTANGNIYLREE